MDRKHIATRPSPISDELRKKVKLANQRLSRLEKAGLRPQSVVNFENQLKAINGQNGNRAKIPRKIQNLSDVLKLDLAVSKFLNNVSTTVSGARRDDKRHRKNFADKLHNIGMNFSSKTVDKLYSYMGDLDLDELLKAYIYDDIFSVVTELEFAKIDPTQNHVMDALRRGIDYVVEYELINNGVPRSYSDMDLLINIALDHGIDAALDQYRFDTED